MAWFRSLAALCLLVDGAVGDLVSERTTPDFTPTPWADVAHIRSAPREDLNGTAFGPLRDYSLHLVDIHFQAPDVNKQYIAHHFCSFPRENYMVCELFLGDQPSDRPIGIEYFVTKEVVEQIDIKERAAFHAHPFEILSGLFVTIGLSEEDERKLLKFIMGTYGKVIDAYADTELPVGPPRLGFALANERQVNWALADVMDRQLALGSTWKTRQEARKAMKAPPALEGTQDYLKSDKVPVFEMTLKPLIHKKGDKVEREDNQTSAEGLAEA